MAPKTRRRRRPRAGSGSACVLSSGGLDSAVLIGVALRRYRRVQPLYIRAGLRWEREEIRALRRFLRALRSPRLAPLVILEAPLAPLYGDGHWSTAGPRPPGFDAGDASVYLPGRNVILFAAAATFSALRGIPVVISGILDANPFPDGTPFFLRAMERALRAGLGAPLRLRAPFRRMGKDRVVRLGRGLPLGLTLSCLRPRRGRHCGDCCKCAERMIAFHRAGLRDPTAYAAPPPAGRFGSTGSAPSWRAATMATTREAPNRATSSR